MQMSHKVAIVQTAIKSISTDTDQDSVVRKAALAQITDFVAAETKAIDDQVAADVAAKLAPAPAAE